MRRRAPRTLAALVTLGLLVTLGVACSGGEQKTGGRHKIDLEIGDLVPLSGSEQPFGATGQKAVNLAIEQIRKAIDEEKADHTVAVSHVNYRSDPRLAQDFAGRLQRDGKTCLVGPWSNAAAIPVANTIAVPKKVVQISPAASSGALGKLEVGGYFNRTIAPDHYQAEALATLVAHALGGAKDKKVSIGMIKNIYGEDLAGTFAAAWKKLGGTIGARVVWEQNLPSYKSQAEELVAPKPDAFAFFDFQDTYLKVATELLKTKKWKPSQSFATDSLAVTNLGASGGATVEGLRGVAPGAPRFGRGAKAFAKLWKSGPAPQYRQPYDTEAFDATVLCYLASVAAGSAEGTRLRNWVRNVSSPPGDKFTWQQLPEAVAALEAGKDIDYQGASGPIDIEPLDTTQPGSPTAGVYDGYRFKDLRLGLYASLSVPPGKPAVQTFPIEFVTPRIPGATAPTPAGASGASGASGATGAKGKSKKNSKGKKAKKKGT